MQQNLPGFLQAEKQLTKHLMPFKQKRYRVVGLVMFVVASSLLLLRFLASLIPSNLGRNIFFSVTVQIGVLVIAVALIYFFILKLKPKEILAFSNFNKTKWYNYLLGIAIGIIGYFVVIGVSFVWMNFIMLLGFSRGAGIGGAVAQAPAFSAGRFVLDIFLIAVLPAICEEFAMRGGFLTTMRGSFKGGFFYFVMAIAFGLFHQNITQFFFTALFGAVMAFVVVKTKSIYPAMLIHFFNNGLSVYFSYARTFGWWGSNLQEIIFGQMFSFRGIMQTFLFFFISLLLLAALIVLVYYLNSAKMLNRKKKVMQNAGYDLTNKRMIIVGEATEEKVAELQELDLDKEVFGEKVEKELFKPKIIDNAWYIGAMVITGLFTVFTFIFGMLV